MDHKEIINKLIETKSEITKLGYEYLQLNLPIGLSEAPKTLKPFSDLEATFDKSIKALKNKEIIEK